MTFTLDLTQFWPILAFLACYALKGLVRGIAQGLCVLAFAVTANDLGALPRLTLIALAFGIAAWGFNNADKTT